MEINNTNQNFSNAMSYKKPVTLSQALEMCRNKEKKCCTSNETTSLDIFIINTKKNEELANTKVTGYLGRGSSAIAFETEDGNVLKLSYGNHFPQNRPPQSFDVPVYKKGKAGKVYYYIEEKLFQHGMTEGFIEIMRDMIRKAGFRTSDLQDSDVFQLGLSKDGKLYLLDPECAKYKTIFHGIRDKIKNFTKNLSKRKLF